MSASSSLSSLSNDITPGFRNLIILQHGYGSYLLPLLHVYYSLMRDLSQCMKRHGNASNWQTFPCYRPIGQRSEWYLHLQQQQQLPTNNELFTEESEWIRYFLPLSSAKRLYPDPTRWDVTVLLSILLHSSCWNRKDVVLIKAADTIRKDRNNLLAHTSSYELQDEELRQAAANLTRLAAEMERVVKTVATSTNDRRQRLTITTLAESAQKFEVDVASGAITEVVAFSSRRSSWELSVYLHEFAEKVSLPTSVQTVLARVDELFKKTDKIGKNVSKVLYYLARFTKEHVFFCTFHSNHSEETSCPGVKAIVTLGNEIDDSLSAQDVKHSLRLNHLSLSDVQIYGLLSRDLTEGYNATSARLMLSLRTEYADMKKAFIESVKWSFQQPDECGFAMPEPHFDVCGVTDGLGRGVGIKRSLSRKVYQRFKQLAETISLNTQQTEEWYLCFLAATSTDLTSPDPQSDVRGYGEGSASDDFVFRLFPFFMQQSSERLTLLRQHRALQQNKEPLITSAWSPLELLQLLCGNSWTYFQPMFARCYDETQLQTPYELLALPHYQIVLKDGSLRHWPIVSISPKFLSFSGTPYGITFQMLETTRQTVVASVPDGVIPQTAEMLAVFDQSLEAEKQNLFYFFLRHCVVNHEFMNQLTDAIALHATCEYAIILPSKVAFDEFCVHMRSAVPRSHVVQQHVLYLTFTPAEAVPEADSILLAVTYINEDAQLDGSVRLSSSLPRSIQSSSSSSSSLSCHATGDSGDDGDTAVNMDVEEEEKKEGEVGGKQARSLGKVVSEVGGDCVGTVVLLFVEAFDMHRSKKRILDVVAPYNVRRVNVTHSKCVLGQLTLPPLTAFMQSDAYEKHFRDESHRIAEPHVCQTSRFSENPSLVLNEAVSIVTSANLDRLLSNPALLSEADSIVGAMDSSLVDNMVGKQRNHRCSILPFLVVTDLVNLREPDLTSRRSLAANIVWRLVSAMLHYGMRRVLGSVDVESALSIALTEGRETAEAARRQAEMEEESDMDVEEKEEKEQQQPEQKKSRIR